MDKRFVVFEHEVLKIGDPCSSNPSFKFEKEDFNTLANYFERQDKFKYYTLRHQGIKFTSYVGVLKIGNLTLEILPKMDKIHGGKAYWRELLISMLQAVNKVKVDAPSSSNLSIKPNSILELYFILFIEEVELIQRRGLIKKYRSKEENNTALKGQLLFHKQITKNLVHKERFFIRHNVYDKNHSLHSILYQTLELIHRYNTNILLSSRIVAAMERFPDALKKVVIYEELFQRISYNRKTKFYQHAMSIAELLLLNFHPDLKYGQKDVLALVFDMNKLWEEFVLLSLKRFASIDYDIKGQKCRLFWEKENKGKSKTRKLQPDIIISNKEGICLAVLDTKWKRMEGSSFAEMSDLRQMYAYLHLFDTECSMLLYPGAGNKREEKGYFYKSEQEKSDKFCSEVYIPLRKDKDINAWSEYIAQEIFKSLK